jgi:hypothetical protein
MADDSGIDPIDETAIFAAYLFDSVTNLVHPGQGTHLAANLEEESDPALAAIVNGGNAGAALDVENETTAAELQGFKAPSEVPWVKTAIVTGGVVLLVVLSGLAVAAYSFGRGSK